MATHVLGYLVETISGRPFADYLQEAVFGPVGMPDTGFFVPDSKAERLCACYSPAPGGGLALQDDPRTAASAAFRPWPRAAAAGVDRPRLSSLLPHAAGRRLDRRAAGTEPQDGGADDDEPSARRQHAGQDVALQLQRGGLSGAGFRPRLRCHAGCGRHHDAGQRGDYFWGGGASTSFWIDPVEDLAVVFMTQLLPSTASQIRRDLRHWIYGALSERK